MKNKAHIFIQNCMWIPFLILGLFDKEFRNAFERLTWSNKQMNQFRLDQLKSIVTYAFNNSPFYRKLYEEAGVRPEDIKSLSDIERLPVLTKGMLRSAITDKTIFTKDRAPFLSSKTSTAGSSGDPLVLYYDFATRKHRFRNTRRALWMMGAFPQKKFALIWRKKTPPLRQRLAAFFGVFKWVSVVDVMNAKKTALGKKEMGNVVNELVEFQPQIIRGYTSALWVLAQLIKKNQLAIKPERVIISAEYLPPVWWQEMEKIFGCPVHNYYGGTEASPIAASVGDEKKLTVFQDYYNTEILNKENKAVGSREVGRVIITDYYNKYMPMIRYEIGDTAEWSDDQIGPFSKFESVHGRINDIFVLPGGKILFSHNWHIYFREIAAISKCKVIQRNINTIDIYIEVVEQDGQWNKQFNSLKAVLLEALGNEVNLRWNVVEKLELDAGDKFRTVRSELDINTIINNL